MESGIIWTAFFKFAVELLLLSAVNRMCGAHIVLWRILCAAAVSAVCSLMYLVPGLRILPAPIWRIISLLLFLLTAFGIGLNALYRSAVYLLISAAIGSISADNIPQNMWTLIAAAASVCIMCVFLPGESERRGCIPVELCYRDKKLRLKAIRDTGNMLIDPITGTSVLVIGADAAGKLTGLSKEQLHSPTQTLCAGILPGLRLIPYKTVGCESGFMLALRLKNVKIGSWRGSSLVAFAPENIGSNGGYQALTGGVL